MRALFKISVDTADRELYDAHAGDRSAPCVSRGRDLDTPEGQLSRYGSGRLWLQLWGFR